MRRRQTGDGLNQPLRNETKLAYYFKRLVRSVLRHSMKPKYTGAELTVHVEQAGL